MIELEMHRNRNRNNEPLQQSNRVGSKKVLGSKLPLISVTYSKMESLSVPVIKCIFKPKRA